MQRVLAQARSLEIQFTHTLIFLMAFCKQILQVVYLSYVFDFLFSVTIHDMYVPIYTFYSQQNRSARVLCHQILENKYFGPFKNTW